MLADAAVKRPKKTFFMWFVSNMLILIVALSVAVVAYYQAANMMEAEVAESNNAMYKDYLTTMNRWYKEGLIDPDYAATDSKLFDAKVTSNVAGSFFSSSGSHISRLDFLAGAPYPIGPAGKSYFTRLDAIMDVPWDGAAISGKNQYVKESIQWLDYHYSDEGRMLMNLGVEGESYVMGNNYPKLTDAILNPPNGLTKFQALAKYAPSGSASPTLADPRLQEQLYNDAQKNAVKTWAGADTSLLMPNPSLTTEEGKQLSAIMNDINTYVAEMYNKFIMGQEPIESFDSYISTLKKMGIEDAIKIRQTALDRYNNRK